MRRPRPLSWLRTKVNELFWWRYLLKSTWWRYLAYDWTGNYLMLAGLFLIAGGWFWPFAVVGVVMIMHFIYLVMASAKQGAIAGKKYVA